MYNRSCNKKHRYDAFFTIHIQLVAMKIRENILSLNPIRYSTSTSLRSS